MAAPRLLDKRRVTADVASQKAQEVKKGIELAKKVDAVRETLLEEEARAEQFRTKTIAAIQKEIDSKVIERDGLKQQIQYQREELARLQKPLDDAWASLRTEQEKYQQHSIHLKEWEANIGVRDAEIEKRNKQLDDRERCTDLKHQAAGENLLMTEDMSLQATQTLERAEKEAAGILARVTSKERLVIQREMEEDSRESALQTREEKVAAHEVDLVNRETVLKDRYATLERTITRLKP